MAALAACAIFAGSTGNAGPISQACLGAGNGTSPRLCVCIQQVADMTLNKQDQRLAAKIIKEPQKAQDVKMSKTAKDDAFWSKYSSFGQAAQAMCS
ncbi:hypothetical protein DL237_17145 [Pseudooceanicola sediminis]|uniref:Arginine transporter n=1 Tax=Pseudooceanicola sediminis TaxID=2211117 RepID=A0A399IWE8_9RHOB|nr:hypothetical protein E0K93_17385 [Puniceibacterium sp. HSS470]RII37475.1 hypothetical protein DL237_17145 [Pseudooceanicola sediminis]